MMGKMTTEGDRERIATLLDNLEALWLAKKPGPNILPSRAMFSHADYRPWMGHLCIYDLHHRADGSIRLWTRLKGSIITEYDKRDDTGKFLDECMSADQYHRILSPYLQALESGQPVRYDRKVAGQSESIYHGVKLVLPLANDGVTVNKFVVAIYFWFPSDRSAESTPYI